MLAMTRRLLVLLLGGCFYLVVAVGCGGGQVAVTPTPEEALSPSPTVEPSPAPMAEPSPIPTVEPSPIPTAEPSPIPTAEPSPIPTVEPSPIPTAEPSPIPTAEPSPTPTAESGFGEQGNLRYDPEGPDRNCSDFETRTEAMAFFKAAGGPEKDPHRLDGDGNGIPCESLRE